MAALFAACTDRVENAVETGKAVPIYPDYTNITIPCNIAPLNFLLRGDYEAVSIEADGKTLQTCSGSKMQFDIADWHNFLKAYTGKTVKMKVFGKKDGKWLAYKPFTWTIANDTIDPILTYRLIEPDYEVWNHLQIQERNITNFDTRQIGDWRLQENRCMNCHAFANQNPNLSMEYIRGKGGGAILNDHGMLRKLDLKASNATDSMVSSSVYYGFSPSGRYITFSTNVIIPAFHAQPGKRLEVYDSKSDVYVADLKTHKILLSRLTADSTQLETFPTFSPDGRYVYYCVANRRGLYSTNLRGLQYSLVRIPFDEKTGKFGTKVDTLVNASGNDGTRKLSVCHPRISPDGRYLLYTVAYYGTFPIWHPEADLRMMDLKTGKVDPLTTVNSRRSDTYHAWSHNSRWFVFASKRDDGLYGKPYFCYVDRKGKAHKPFVLPQHDPSFYDKTLKSFNVPELGTAPLPFDAVDVEKAMKQPAEKFTLVE